VTVNPESESAAVREAEAVREPEAVADPEVAREPQAVRVPDDGSDVQTSEMVPDALFPSVTSSDPRVADALSRLDEADRLPLPEQVAVYADIHRRLAGVLADPDSQA
jgi:hypothetical protein